MKDYIDILPDFCEKVRLKSGSMSTPLSNGCEQTSPTDSSSEGLNHADERANRADECTNRAYERANRADKRTNRFSWPIDEATEPPSSDSVLEATPHLNDNDLEEIKIRYKSLIGALRFLSTTLRPDSSFCVSHLARFQVKPRKQHLLGVVQVIRYLKKTRKMGLMFTKERRGTVTA
jgi:hypothetical protein